MRVSVGGHHLKDATINCQNADVKGTTTQIKHQNVLLSLLLVQAIGDGRSRRLVDDASNVQSGDDAGVLGGLALCVIEISCSRQST